MPDATQAHAPRPAGDVPQPSGLGRWQAAACACHAMTHDVAWHPLPIDAPLAAYDVQAANLLAAWGIGDADAVQFFRHHLPRFLRTDAPWLPLPVSDADILGSQLDHADARMAVARAYDFAEWNALAELVDAVQDRDSPVARFEASVDAVVAGDLDGLRAALGRDPGLSAARSTRRTHFDPSVHGAMLLHYVAANGVEGHRQRTPPNAVDIARALLEAGADPDATARLYGGDCTTMSLLVSSSHPARAGVQAALVHLLMDFGASVEPQGSGAWTAPLRTALTSGYRDAALALVARGATVTAVADAAGLGDRSAVTRLLPDSSADDRHAALALAAAHGHAEIVGLLLDTGTDPDRYNPPRMHAHSTPLHQAVAAGHENVVRLLIQRGARVDQRDTLYGATPLGWAEHLRQDAIGALLRRHAADQQDGSAG